jgi:hypothetical protein
MDRIEVKLSGSVGGTEIVKGFAVGGLFVHHPIIAEDKPQAWRDQWVISHTRSGMSFGCWFDKRTQAMNAAREIIAVYNVAVEPRELVEQFRNRGEKPSVAEIAEKHGMRL